MRLTKVDDTFIFIYLFLKTMASKNRNLLRNLIRANQGVLKQKLSLLETLQAKYGSEKTANLFTTVCPIVNASIGQHYRHSMDHVELAVLVAFSAMNNGLGSTGGDVNMGPETITLNYDLRVRGGTLEKDAEEATKRIVSVSEVLQQIENNKVLYDEDEIVDEKVFASFMLSGNKEDPEVSLTSTIGRELGFSAHHALHHLAMVKVIATRTIGLEEQELGSDFGKAPSTVRYEAKET